MTILAALPKLMRLAMTAPYAQGTTPPTTYLQSGFSKFIDGMDREPLDTGRNVGFGTLSKPVTRVVENRRMLRPIAGFVPTVAEWQLLLEWILGADGLAPSATGNDSTTEYLYLPADQVKRRRFIWDDTQQVNQFNEVAAMKTTITAEQGSELTVEIEMVGKDWTPVTFPATLQQDFEPSLYFTAATLNFPNLTTPIAGGVCKRFTLTVMNMIDPDRFFNSLLLSEPIKYDRTVTLALEIPYGTHKILRITSQMNNATAIVGGTTIVNTGVAVEAKFALGGKSLRFLMPNVIAWEKPATNTVANTPSETMINWEGTCYAPVVVAAAPPPATTIGMELRAYLDVTA